MLHSAAAHPWIGDVEGACSRATRPGAPTTSSAGASASRRPRRGGRRAGMPELSIAASGPHGRGSRRNSAPATTESGRQRLGAPPPTSVVSRPRRGPRTPFVRCVDDRADGGDQSTRMFVGECRRFIRWAGAEGSGVACPDFVGEFRCPSRPQEEPKHLEPEHVAQFRQPVRGTKWEPPVALAALAGLRRAEFYGLQTSDVDWDRQVLLVRATKTHRDAKLEFSPPLMEILKRHRVVAGPVVRLGPHIRAAYTGLHRFCRRVHLRLRVAKYLADPASGCTKNREALVRARADWAAGDRDFPPISWHTLRHSFATALLANGVDLRTVQDLMRHKTAAMTMRYAHSTSERRRAAVEKVLA